MSNLNVFRYHKKYLQVYLWLCGSALTARQLDLGNLIGCWKDPVAVGRERRYARCTPRRPSQGYLPRASRCPDKYACAAVWHGSRPFELFSRARLRLRSRFAFSLAPVRRSTFLCVTVLVGRRVALAFYSPVFAAAAARHRAAAAAQRSRCRCAFAAQPSLPRSVSSPLLLVVVAPARRRRPLPLATCCASSLAARTLVPHRLSLPLVLARAARCAAVPALPHKSRSVAFALVISKFSQAPLFSIKFSKGWSRLVCSGTYGGCYGTPRHVVR